MKRTRAIGAAALACFALGTADADASSSATSSAHGAKMALATADSDQIFPGGFEQLFTLTVSNYIDWCSISVNNGPAAADDPIVSFEKNRVIALHGDTVDATYFHWGFWNGTDAGDPDTNMDTAVTMSSDRSVTACCPDNGFDTCP